jgi:hypothetical protein
MFQEVSRLGTSCTHTGVISFKNLRSLSGFIFLITSSWVCSASSSLFFRITYGGFFVKNIIKLSLASLFLVASVAAQAQQEQPKKELPESIFVNPRPAVKNPQDSFWFQITIPSSNIGPFPVKIQDERSHAGGVAGEFGWQPWLKNVTDQDSQLVKLLKSAGLSVAYTHHERADYPNLLATIFTKVTNIDSTCYDREDLGTDEYGNTIYGDRYWNNKCKPCPSNIAEQAYCTSKDIHSRDGYIKYSEGSVAIGFYLPYSVGRLTLLGGTNLRMHFIREGIRDDQITDSTEYSTSVVLGVRYKFTPHWGVVGTAERSVLGLKYRQYGGGLVVTW